MFLCTLTFFAVKRHRKFGAVGEIQDSLKMLQDWAPTYSDN